MQKPTDFSNLFLDMNAFFASVEQQVQPTLRGKPVAIAPYTGNTGCVIARSYEAKKFGVEIGTVATAKKLCPQVKIIESHPELYLYYHRRILKVLESFSPYVEVKSVDEFNIRLTGSDKNEKKAVKMAEGLKEKINKEVGDYLKCSIGVASSFWLAKLVGESKKPDGLTVLKLKELLYFYKNLKLTDLPGINVRMERQLHRKKIKSVLEFYGSTLSNLSLWFNHPGRVWYYRLRGYEIDTKTNLTKSIGHSHVLAPEFRTKILARRVLSKLAEKCAARLRSQRFYAQGISVGISYLGGSGFFKKKKLDLVSDSSNIQKAAFSLYDSINIYKPPLKIAVTLFDLAKTQNEQISLFLENEKSKEISKTMDKINDRYGSDTIYPASMFDVDDAAPDRIPFGPPRLDTVSRRAILDG